MAPTQNVNLEDLPTEIINTDQLDKVDNENWQSGLSNWLSEIYQSNSKNMLEIIEPELDKVIIDFALEKAGGKKQDAAKVLGIGRNTLSKKIKAQKLNAKTLLNRQFREDDVNHHIHRCDYHQTKFEGTDVFPAFSAISDLSLGLKSTEISS